MDRQFALKLFSLKDNATKDEVSKRYTVILKKFRSDSSEEPGKEFSHIDMDEFTNAYNVLMGYELNDPLIEAEERKPPGKLLKKIGIDEKKARNFLHYHKIHMIIGILAVIFLAYTIKGCVNKIPEDFNMAFIGNIFYNDAAVIKKNIIEKYPGIREIGIDSAMIGASQDSQQEYAMQMKAMVLFAAGDVDIYILDKASFERYGVQGAFTPLDTLLPELGIDKNSQDLFRLTIEGEKAEQVYGINIKSSKVLISSGVIGDELIIAVNVNAKKRKQAETVLKILLVK